VNINEVRIAGRLTRDPELRVTPKGTPICQFSVAINRTWKDGDGNKREEVYYADIEAWGRTAENISKYFNKGQEIYVAGYLRLDQWEEKDTGKKRSRTKIVLERFEFVGGRNDGANTGGGGDSAERNAPPAGRGAYGKPPPQDDIDDVPF
jgi:single-strand DNA-binding protein